MSQGAARKDGFGWKDAALGGLITVVVTTVAGIAVWYFTREPERSERLVYRVEAPASFASEGRGIRLQVITVRNEGSVKSNGVTVDIQIPTGVRVADNSVSFSSGSSVRYQTKPFKQGLSLVIPVLLPKEIATLSLLTTGTASRSLSFSVRSEQSIGSREDSDRVADRRAGILRFTLFVIALVSMLSIAGTQYISFRRRSRFNAWMRQQYLSLDYSPSRNNLGFLLMHNGLLDEAEEIFWEEIKKGEAGLVTLSHYGALLLLKGDQKGEAYLSASKWPGSSSIDSANLLVDQFIVSSIDMNVEAARNSFKHAILCNPNIGLFFQQSRLLKSIVSRLSLEDFIAHEIQPIA